MEIKWAEAVGIVPLPPENRPYRVEWVSSVRVEQAPSLDTEGW